MTILVPPSGPALLQHWDLVYGVQFCQSPWRYSPDLRFPEESLGTLAHGEMGSGTGAERKQQPLNVASESLREEWKGEGGVLGARGQLPQGAGNSQRPHVGSGDGRDGPPGEHVQIRNRRLHLFQSLW